MLPYLRTEPWTFDETIDLPREPGYRYEVVDGVLHVAPPVTAAHQRASTRLMVQLVPQLDPAWEVCLELGISMGQDGRRPDGAVIRRDARTGPRAMGVAARDFALVLEVVSPSSRKVDRFFKPAEYAAAGVPAYWRLEPDPQPRLHVHALEGETYREVHVLSGAGRVSVPFPLTLDLDALF